MKDEIDPFMVEVSLHGARAETHDRQTQVEGSFERLISNLTELSQLGLRVKINSTLTRWNETEVDAMFTLADGLSMTLQFDPEVTPRDDGSREPLSISASPEGLRHLRELQAERARRRQQQTDDSSSATRESRSPREGDAAPTQGAAQTTVAQKHCGAGSSTVTIDPFGNVVPCVQWRHPVGNVHDTDLATIWSGATGLSEVRETNVAVKQQIVELGEAAPATFCPGLHASRTGSALPMTPAPKHDAEVQATRADEPLATGPRRRSLPVLVS